MHYSCRDASGTVRRVVHPTGLNAAVVEVLSSERKAARLSLAELAERSGVPLVTVQRLMAGRRGLRLDTLDALCAGLQVSPAVVLTLATQDTPAGGKRASGSPAGG